MNDDFYNLFDEDRRNNALSGLFESAYQNGLPKLEYYAKNKLAVPEYEMYDLAMEALIIGYKSFVKKTRSIGESENMHLVNPDVPALPRIDNPEGYLFNAAKYQMIKKKGKHNHVLLAEDLVEVALDVETLIIAEETDHKRSKAFEIAWNRLSLLCQLLLHWRYTRDMSYHQVVVEYKLVHGKERTEAYFRNHLMDCKRYLKRAFYQIYN